MVDVYGGWRPPPRTSKLAYRVLSLPLVLLVAVLLCTGVDARSPHPPPLRRIHHPSSASLEILPRHPPNSNGLRPKSYIATPNPSTLRHSDTLLVSIYLPSLLTHEAHLLLRPTENLFHPDARITFENGDQQPLRAEDWRLYTGDVIHPRWRDRVMWEEKSGLRDDETYSQAVIGSARIMVHHPGSVDQEPAFEGLFTIDGVHYNILTQDHYARVKTPQDIVISSDEFGSMVVFRKSDAWHDADSQPNHHTMCSHDSLPFNSNLSHPVWANRFGDVNVVDGFGDFFRRDDTGGMSGSSNYINSIGNPAGCPSTQQIVYMGVALDCNYISTYGSAEAARTQVLNDWNQVSALYRSTFNISLGITEVVVRNMTCPTQAVQGTEWDVSCDKNLTLDQRLSLFSQWRGNRSDDGVGLWHLKSACPTDSEVGVAWLATLCQTTSNFQSGSYVSGTSISTATKEEWSLVAHEIGHGFGAIHDCTSGCSLQGQCCPSSSSSCDAGGKFIMNPTTSDSEQTFSACTLGNICSNIGSKLVSSSCIQAPGEKTVISLQQCGNGIVDAGEECDPGLNGDSTCCDPQTCKFKSGAQCDPSNSACCTSSCQFASAGTVCRPAVDVTCDFAETCTGSNATCPADKTANDGTSCGSNGLACASGRCTSLDQQCLTAGASMNLTNACGQRNDKSCVVSCRDPRVTNQCVVLQTPLVDGSPCGYGGHCHNQTCQTGSWQDTAGAWYRTNLNISIPVTVVAGLIALAIISFLIRCIFRACANRGGTRTAPNVPSQRQSMRQSRFAGPNTNVVPVMQRHSASLSSQDAITQTGVIPRDSSPVPVGAGGAVGGSRLSRNSRGETMYGDVGYTGVVGDSPPRVGTGMSDAGPSHQYLSAQPPPPIAGETWSNGNEWGQGAYNDRAGPGGYDGQDGGAGYGGYGGNGQQGYGFDQTFGGSNGGYDQRQQYEQQQQQQQQQQIHPSQQPQPPQWIDERLYNGPHYGREEAWGR